MKRSLRQDSQSDILVSAMEGNLSPSSGRESRLNLVASFVDARRAPADTRGMLVDRQIRSHDLHAVAEHVTQNWPAVKSLRCQFANGFFRFFIGISPFSTNAQWNHWPLATWIENELGIRDGCYLFVPPASNEPLNGEVVVV